MAHHRDDQVGTVMLKWLRGCHVSNLRGMEWRRGPFVRPLLGCRKDDLYAFLREGGCDWREDVSNQEPKYHRNRLRLQVRQSARPNSG